MPEASASVERWAAELDDDYLGCRVWQHNWSRPRKYEWDTKRQAYRALRRCSRCKTRRYVYLDRRWRVKANDYEYPDGFLRPSGSGQLDKTERALLRGVDMSRGTVVD